MFIFWLLIVPFFIGQLFNSIIPTERKSLGISFLLGFFAYLAVFEVIAIPCMMSFKWNAFIYCTRIFSVVAITLTIIGLFRFDRTVFSKRIRYYQGIDTKILYFIFFALILFQMVMGVVMQSFDGDDAYYVASSVSAQQVGVMNTINPTIGRSAPIDSRHALSAFNMWIAFVGKASGVHATIVSHTVIPLLIIPLVYLVYYEIAKVLFKNKKEMIPMFMIIINALMIFGNVSIYTPATFFLTRTWQGKAVMSNIVLPAIFLIFMWMYEDAGSRGGEAPSGTAREAIRRELKAFAPYWTMLVFLNMFSGTTSSLAVVFGSGLIALLTLILMYMTKKWSHVVGAFLCVIPNIIYVAVYLLIKHQIWRL